MAPLSLLCIRPLLGIDVLPLLYIRLPTTKPTTLPNFEKKTNNLILLAAAVSFFCFVYDLFVLGRAV